MPLDFDSLRRWPDVEAPDLLATDAADRLILDESAPFRAGLGDGRLAVIGDAYGALTLGAADDGATGIRVHQDALSGEGALDANAYAADLDGSFRSLDLLPELVADAEVVLVRLPRSLDALADIADLIARHAAPGVVVVAGGRLKHMTVAMNEVLQRSFGRLDVSLARQKSRVLIAREPRELAPYERVRTAHHDSPLGPLEVCAVGGVFAGDSIDIGTRFLLDNLPAEIPGDRAVDFACGTGVVGAALALRHPSLVVIASDQSAAAVVSARATVAANGLEGRMTVERDDGLSLLPDASESFIALNPPFHVGAAVTGEIAPKLFAEAGRVLAPGGQLWAVWNTPMGYRAALNRFVGPTRQVARNAKFTVTVSERHERVEG